MKLRWTNPALLDVTEIYDHIAEHNPIAARKVARLLRAQVEGLTTYPAMGRLGRVEGTRELVVSSSAFIIAYRVTETTVDILAIRHGAQQWPDKFEEDPSENTTQGIKATAFDMRTLSEKLAEIPERDPIDDKTG